MEDVKKIIFMKLPNKQKILFVDKINPFNLIFLIFFRIYFDKIFFLEIVRSLRNKKLLSLFEIIGLNWVNYTYYDLEKVHNNRGRKTIDFEDKYAIYISKKIWINSLSIFFLNKDLFAACIMSKIHTRLHHMYEIIEVAQVFKQKNRVYLMMSNDFFFKTINKDYNFKNINIINYEVFKVFDFIFLAFLKLCLVIFKKITSISFYDKKSYE